MPRATVYNKEGQSKEVGLGELEDSRSEGWFGSQEEAKNYVDPTSNRIEMEGLLPKYTKAGNTYYDSTKATGDKYLSGLKRTENDYKTTRKGLMMEAEEAGTQADKTYGEVSGHLKSMMDSSAIDAGNAMTLAESMDPNNKVAAGFRGFYEDQAQGARQRGMADVGVMQALGAQAFGGQMGAYGPMTGGQMSALMGQNQNQSGQAMANVQRRVQNLRDQGIEEGWNQTNLAYDRGQGAKDRYTNDTLNYEGAGNRYQLLKGGMREERAGYGEDIRGSDSLVNDAYRDNSIGLSNLRYGLDTGDYDKQAAIISDTWANQRAEREAELDRRTAKYAAEQGKEGSVYGGLASGIIPAVVASDIRLKKDIRPITVEDAQEFIEAVNPVYFKYKDDDSKEQVGLIAQDIKDTALGAHIVEEHEGFLMLNNQQLIGTLVACVALLGGKSDS